MLACASSVLCHDATAHARTPVSGHARNLARSATMSHTSRRFGVLVPVKPVGRAKSRLSQLGDQRRRALVSAFAADTVSAALSCSRVDAVMVVTDDHELAHGLAGMGAGVVPDGVSGDLNASLEQAAAELQRRRPGLAPAALCADLPALRTRELTEALDLAADRGTAVVADAAGTGTTMYTADSNEAFHPRFGHGSLAAHVDAGAHEIDEVDVPTLRRDVDTPEDLRAALELGVGPRTALVAAGLTLGGMQATVSAYDPATRSGAVLLDDGVELSFAADAVEGTGLRLLRPGQRVRVELSGEAADTRVDRLQILTLH